MSTEIKQELLPNQADLKRTIERIRAFSVADNVLAPATADRAISIAKEAFDMGMTTQSVFFSEGEIELSFYFGVTCDITLHITNTKTRVGLCAAQCPTQLQAGVMINGMLDVEILNMLRFLMAFKLEDGKS